MVGRRRAQRGQLAMIISGGFSTLAGINFIASSNNHTAHLAMLAGYMTLGGLLYLLSAHRRQTAS